MSYAIIHVGGKQYRVREGEWLLVDRLPYEQGATFTPDVLLIGGDGDALLGDELKGQTVTATVTEHLLGKKVIVGKHRRRTGYRRRNGFRARLSKIQRYHTEVFADFLAKLAKMPDGDGSLLDHSMLLYGSNMSNSNAHNQYPLPISIVGGGCGRIRGGQHINFAQRTPLANVLLTLLQRAGVQIDRVGDSTGAIAEV